MKKFITILSVFVFLLLPSVVLSGCGDKYKKMSLDVQYYQCKLDGTEGEWVSIDSNKESESYGLDFVLNDAYKVNKADTYYTLRCRVIVKGTKKSVGDISVAVSGTGVAQLNKSTVKAGEEVTLKVFDSGSATLTFVPGVKSEQKTVEFPINIYRELGEIKATESYHPALIKGGQLELNKLTDLIEYIPAPIEGKDDVGETNQRGVTYSLVDDNGDPYSINDNGEYIIWGGNYGENILAKLETKNNINRLSVYKDFDEKSLKIKATSVYSYKTSDNKEISCTFDVYAVDARDNVYINYDIENVGNSTTSLSEIELFPKTAGYNEMTVALTGVAGGAGDGFTFDMGDDIHLSITIYVDGKKVNDNMVEAYNGIKIIDKSKTSENAGENDFKTIKRYSITATEDDSVSANEIKFVIGFENLKFTGDKGYNLENSVITKVLKVNRTVLPSNIMINGALKEANSEESINLYTEYPSGSKGLNIKIGSMKAPEISMGVYTDSTRKEYGGTYHPISVTQNLETLTKGSDNLYKLTNETNSLYFMFSKESDKSYPSVVYIKLSVRTIPSKFKGADVTSGVDDYIHIYINLNVVGALSDVELTDKDPDRIDIDKIDLVKRTSTTILQADVKNMVYLNLKTSGGIAAKTDEIIIKALENHIQFSADGVNYFSSISCDKLIGNILYFKSSANSRDKIIILAENGFEYKTCVLQFVDIAQNGVKINYDKTNIFEAGTDAEYYTDENEIKYEGYYLALQRSKNVSFYFDDGEKNSSGIYQVDVVTCSSATVSSMGKEFDAYGSSVVSITKYSYGLSITGVISNQTTLLKVTAYYYSRSADAFEVRKESLAIYLEIAVYTPVTSLDIKLDRSEIYYINAIIDDQSTANIEVAPNSDASKTISFSNATINEKLNNENNGANYIYSIFINKETKLSSLKETGVSGTKAWLNLTNSKYSLTVGETVTKDTNIVIKFTIKGLCDESGENPAYTQVYYKTIRVVPTTASKSIRVEGTFSNNVYLSLNGTKETSFRAYILPRDATYKKLGYQLYEFDESKSGSHYIDGNEIILENLSVEISDDNVTINAENMTVGGKYVLRLVSLDSFSGGKYSIDAYIVITISDGSLVNPYYLYTLDDLTKITNAPDKHYVLAADIDLTSLDSAICLEFSGSINGMLTIYDANDKTVSYSQYKLKNLKIGNAIGEEKDIKTALGKGMNNNDDKFRQHEETANSYYYGLFGKLSGEIKNLIVENASIKLGIIDGNDAPLYIGILAGKNTGSIINSSVTIKQSQVDVAVSETSNYSSYNIGGIVGLNSGNISFYNEGNDSLKQYTNYEKLIDYLGEFKVNISNLYTGASFNVGGIVGDNSGTIEANYFEYDGSGKKFSEYLTGRVNINLANNDTDNKATISLGGVAGTSSKTLTAGGVAGTSSKTLTAVSLTGSVKASGNNINLGGFVGNNTADITNCTSYALDVVATNGGTLSKVLVGGVSGTSSGEIEDVYVLFLNLSSVDSRYTNKGKVSGGTAIGGIVGELTGGTLNNTNIQSFVSGACIESQVDGAEIAGLVGSSSGGSIDLCYARVDIKGKTVSSLINGSATITNAYFVGRLEGSSGETLNNGNNVFSLKLTDNDTKGILWYYGTKYYYELNGDTNKWYDKDNNEITNIINEFSSLGTDWEKSDYLSYNYGLPLLVKVGKLTLYVLPNELNVDIREKFFKTEPKGNGEYLANGSVYTAIIYLSKDETKNEYDFINGTELNGLLNMEFIPAFATKEYDFEIIEGKNNFILKNNRIKFINTGRIEIKFYSLFSADVSDTVIFFVEDEVEEFEILKGGVKAENLNLYTGDNHTILLPSVGKSNIDTTKLLFKFDVSETDIIDVSALNGKVGAYYNYSDIELISKKEGEVRLTVTLYLNLKKYQYNETQTLADVCGKDVIELKEFTITISVHPSATDLKINTSDTTIATGETTSIVIETETSYINEADKTKTTETTVAESEIKINENYLHLNIGERDSIYFLLETDEETYGDLEAVNLTVNSLWDLFNYKFNYILNSGKTGYIYTLEISLKEEYRETFRTNRQFVFTAYATSNKEKHDSFTLYIEPQELSSIRIDNFKTGGAYKDEKGETIIEYSSKDTPSSIIEPGKSGLLKIYMEPSYSRVDEIIISSEPVTYNGKTYTIRFEQMIYDETVGHYVNYLMGVIDEENNSLKLEKVSFKTTDGYKYTGVIYVRTVLESAIGLAETFSIKVVGRTFERNNDGEILDSVKTERTTTKLLISQYNPGITLEPTKGAEEIETGKYIVSKDVKNLEIKATIVGYEFNSVPDITLSWLDETTNGISQYISYTSTAAVRQTDGSYVVTYTLTTKKSLEQGFKFFMSLGILQNGKITDTKSNELTFYPVDYLPSEVYLEGTASNVLRLGVNSIKNLNIVWLDSDGNRLDGPQLTSKIADLDNQNKGEKSKWFYITTSPNSSEGLTFGNAGDLNKYFEFFNDGAKYSVMGVGEYYKVIKFKVYYIIKYDETNEKYTIDFESTDTEATKHYIEYSFALDIRVETTEEDPDPVYTADGFLSALTDGANLILMDNITLENWAPSTAKIASLDGNNKKIYIKSFSVPTSSTEILGGLFATIDESTIIKNLTIDIGKFSGNENDNTVLLADTNAKDATTYFGFLAGINNGNVYNCEVINTSTSDKKEIKIKTSSKTSYIGGLVGGNSGNITNSRFGTPYFLNLTVDDNYNVNATSENTKIVTITGSGIMGGLVGINNSKGIISSSYFYNANLINENTLTIDTYNMTAGLVAVNTSGAKVLNSYAKGAGISTSKIRGTNTKVASTKAGSVAGFVFENSGIIENCYSNILVESSAGGVAGFVYKNNASGEISKAYSASQVSSLSTPYTTQLPFVGVGIDGDEQNKLLSYGKLNNCYYLKLTSDEFSTSYDYSGTELAYPLDATNFANSENLTNFAFVNGDSEQDVQGIWTYYQTMDKNNSSAINLGKTVLPELTSANQISRSIRTLKKISTVEERQTFIYGKNYELGSSNNPYILRDSEEYNTIFSLSSSHANVITGYFRVISDISFDIEEESGATTPINSASGYVLGDSLNHNLTVFDGNGMTISGVNVKDTENKSRASMGMFSEIYYAIVKNLNIEYASVSEDSTQTSTKAIYSGGLAGRISDSFIIDLTISGQNSTIWAQNFAGGLAGIVLGDSGLYNIKTNIKVKAAYTESSSYNQYISGEAYKKYASRLGYDPTSYQNYLKKLSYAGGLAGVIDINPSATEFSNKTNVMKITVGEDGAQVDGDIAGFVAGYLSRGVNAKRLKSVVTDSSYVSGSYISGGLIGENYGTIEFSQVASIDSAQDEYDDEFASYILKLDENAIDNDDGAYGNLSFVRGNSALVYADNYAGGFVGVNYGGSIKNSYTKGSVNANTKYVGGFAGATFGGGYESVYAENYINVSLTDNAKTKYVGGFASLNGAKSLEGVSKVYSLLGYSLGSDTQMIIDDVVVANFYDRAQLKAIKDKKDDTDPENEFKLNITYFIAKSGNTIRSNQGGDAVSINMYYLSYENINNITRDVLEDKVYAQNSDSLALGNKTITLSGKSVGELYDLTYEGQSNMFDNLFASFDSEIWDKAKDAHKHYMPKLTEKKAINYYEIRTEQDLMQIRLHPDGDFRLMNDITLSGQYVNYVLDIEFTGTLTSDIDTSTASSDIGSRPAIKGIKIYTDGTTSTAGFFKSTKGAYIYGVNFVYDWLVVMNNDGKEFVGLLSAEDINSEFSSINISTDKNIINDPDNTIGKITIKTLSKSFELNTNYNSAQIVTTGSYTVQQFGGILGNSVSSRISNCAVSADTMLSGKSGTVGESYENYWGGLAGYATGSGTNDIDYIVNNSSYSGNAYLTNYTYVGGLAGKALNASFSHSKAVLNKADDENTFFTFSNTMFVGGIFGYQGNSYSISNVSNMTLNNYDGTGGMVYLGGISGVTQNEDNDRSSDIESNGAQVILNMNQTGTGGYSSALIYGGFVGKSNQNVKINNSVAWTSGTAKFKTIYFGGAIGEIDDTTRLVYINNSFIYLESANSSDASGVDIKADKIMAGGFYGNIKANEVIISTTNSHAVGAIWASSDGSSTAEDKMLVMGGLIGSWGSNDKDLNFDKTETTYEADGVTEKETFSTNFTNVYTTVALESSHYSIGNVEYLVNALIGQIVGENINALTKKLNGANVYYSSDLNLAVEEKDIFADGYKNLLAGSILEEELKVKYFDNLGWKIDYGLPYRTDLSDVMKKLSDSGNMSLYTRASTTVAKEYGSSLRPICINNNGDETSKEFNKTNPYQYYYLSKTIIENNIASNSDDQNKRMFTLTGELQGFLIGGGALIMDYSVEEMSKASFSDSNISNMTEHSVISNLQIQYNSVSKLQGASTGCLAGTNNGTIFNVYIDYYSQESQAFYGGGLVGTNNGNILYCYNSGTLDKVSSGNAFGGICNENNGFIYSTAFVGSIASTSSNFGGICVSNDGTVSNCYSAGVLGTNGNFSTLIKENSGTVKNCFYDKYANAEFGELKSDSGEELLIRAVETSSLQSLFVGDSFKLNGNWKTYRMGKVIENGVKSKSESYNYGYPVYHLEQEYAQINSTTNVLEEKTFYRKGLYTGDGSSKKPYLISNIGTLYAINGYGSNDIENPTVEETRDDYFKLINDIDFNKNKKNDEKSVETGICGAWTGIGSASIKKYGTEFTSQPFTGNFNGGSRGAGIWIDINIETKTEINRQISNIKGVSGLFNEVSGGASISNLTINGATIKGSTIGALINTAVNDNSGKITITSVGFGDGNGSNGELKLNASTIGGFIGAIEGAHVEMNNINTTPNGENVETFGKKVNLYSSGSNAGDMGLLVGINNGTLSIGTTVPVSDGTIETLSAGTAGAEVNTTSEIVTDTTVGVKLKETEEGKEDGVYSATNVGVITGTNKGNITIAKLKIKGVAVGANQNVGTLAGVSNGSIKIEDGCQFGDDGQLRLGVYSSSGSQMGGLVGTLNQPIELDFNMTDNMKLTVYLGKLDEESLEEAKRAGGAEYTGGIAGVSTTNIQGEAKLEVAIKLIKAFGYAGGVVGKFESATGVISGITVDFGELETKSKDDNDAKSGESSYAKEGLGGVVGEMISGNIGTYSTENAKAKAASKESNKANQVIVKGKITVTDAPLLGGVAAIMNSGAIVDVDLTEVELLKAVTFGDAKISFTEDVGIGGLVGVVKGSISLGNITMKGTEISGDVSYKNIGGLFGQLATNLITAVSSEEGVDFKIDISDKLKVSGVENVGGFAGLYSPDESASILSIPEVLADLIKAQSDAASGKSFAQIELLKAETSGVKTSSVTASEEESKNVTATALISAQDTGGATGATGIKKNVASGTSYLATNIGGLFGYFDSVGSLGYTLSVASEDDGGEGAEGGGEGGEEGETEVEIVTLPFGNYNQVLYYDNSNNTGLDNYLDFVYYKVVTNVGGIAGLTHTEIITGSNNAHVGAFKKNANYRTGGYAQKGFPKDFYPMSNVGGIVGKYEQRSGYAAGDITISDVSVGAMTISGYEQVGGIVGAVDGAGLEVNVNLVTLDSVVINGFYNVGGVLGDVYGQLIFENNLDGENEGSIKISTINGRMQVGGLFGHVRNSESSVDTIKISGIKIEVEDGVEGIGNVGGYVGYMDNVNSTLSAMQINDGTSLNISSEIKLYVKGNANVGTIVGLYNHKTNQLSKLENFNIENTKVYAFDYLCVEASGSSKDIYYLPTSVGGLAGYADNVYFSSCSLDGAFKDQNGVLYQELDGKDTTPEAPVSSVGNYLVASGSAEYNFEGGVDFRLYEDTATGIGAFVGTFNPNYNKKATADPDNPSLVTAEKPGLDEECYSTISVDVENGLNVGGFIGCINIAVDEEYLNLEQINKLTIGGVKETENPVDGVTTRVEYYTSVIGGMGVGGVFGRISGINSSAIKLFKIQSYEVRLQQRIDEFDDDTGEPKETTSVFGEYVGGYVGYANGLQAIQISNATYQPTSLDAEITSKGLIIDNTRGGYYGGIVGWLSGNLSGRKTQAVNEKAYSCVEEDIFVDVSVHNYGGLVGLLSVNTDASHATEVYGEHYYDFTVDTVLLSNNSYSTKDAQADAEETNKNIILSGIITLDTDINISITNAITSGGMFYSYKKETDADGKTKIVRAKDANGYINTSRSTTQNPCLRTYDTDGTDVKNATGWHEEYSMFRLIEVEQKDSTNKENYEREVLYNAQYIEGVAVVGTKIINTVYNPNGEALMYTRFGIARAVSTSSSVDSVEDAQKYEVARLYGLGVATSKGEATDYAGLLGVKEYTEKKGTVKINTNVEGYENMAELETDLTNMFKNFRSEKVYTTPAETKVDGKDVYTWGNALQENFTLTQYFTTDRLGKDGQVRVFKFETIFADISGYYFYDDDYHAYGTPIDTVDMDDSKIEKFTGKEIGEQGTFTWSLADSGSLFDVCGHMSGRTPNKIDLSQEPEEPKEPNWFQKAFRWLQTINYVRKQIVKIAAKCIWTAIFSSSGVSGALDGAASAVGMLMENEASHMTSTQVYMTSIYEGEYGLISQIYSRPWTFGANNTINSTIDDMIYVDVYPFDVEEDQTSTTAVTLPYIYCGRTRPKNVDETIQVEGTTLEYGESRPYKIPKYQYVNGKYYISYNALTSDPISIDPKSEGIDALDNKSNALRMFEGADGEFYYYAGIQIGTVPATGVVVNDKAIKINPTVQKYVDMHYTYDKSFDEEMNKNGGVAPENTYELYDYIKLPENSMEADALKINWRISTSSTPNKAAGDLGYYFDFYVNKEGRGTTEATTGYRFYFDKSSGGASSTRYYAHATTADVTNTSLVADFNLNDKIYTADVIKKAKNQTILEWLDGSKPNEVTPADSNFFEKNYYNTDYLLHTFYLKATTEETGIVKENVCYCLVGEGYFAGYAEDVEVVGSGNDYDASSLNTQHPLKAITSLDAHNNEEDVSVILYKKNGENIEAYSIRRIVAENKITSQEELTNYFIVDPSLLDENDKYSMKFYNATNYYAIGKNAKGENALYKYEKSLIIEEVAGGTMGLAKLNIDTSGLNLDDGKYIVSLGSKNVYVHYPYDTVNYTKLKEFTIEKGGTPLNPLSDPKQFNDYYFNEVVMVQLKNRTSGKGINGYKIELDEDKVMNKAPQKVT